MKRVDKVGLLLAYLGALFFMMVGLVSAGTFDFAPYGITCNDTFIWITDYATDEVYQYEMDSSYVGSWDTAGTGNIAPFGIVHNNTYIWITDFGDSDVHKYYMNGTNISTIDVATWNATISVTPQGITQNGSDFWIVDASYKGVFKYDMDFVVSNISFKTDSENSQPYGVTNNNTYMWITDGGTSKVYRYYMNGTFTGENWTTYSVNTAPLGIAYSDGYLYTTDYLVKDVFKYYENGTYIARFIIDTDSSTGGAGWFETLEPPPLSEVKDVILGGGSFSEIMEVWNPSVYPTLSPAFGKIFYFASIKELPSKIWTFSLLFFKFIFRQPASLVDMEVLE